MNVVFGEPLCVPVLCVCERLYVYVWRNVAFLACDPTFAILLHAEVQ